MWSDGRVIELLTIGEVAARSGVEPSALRFYESRGLIRSERTTGGQRRYRREVLRRVAFIRIAQRVGLSLHEIGDALDGLPARRTPTQRDWARLSQHWRARLDQQIAAIEALRDELTSCIGCGCLSFKTCALYNPDDRASTLGPGARYLLGDRAGDVVSRRRGQATHDSE